MASWKLKLGSCLSCTLANLTNCTDQGPFRPQPSTSHQKGRALKQGKDIPQTVARTARSATGICLLYKARCTFFRCLRCPVLHPRRCERRPASTFLAPRICLLALSFVAHKAPMIKHCESAKVEKCLRVPQICCVSRSTLLELSMLLQL